MTGGPSSTRSECIRLSQVRAGLGLFNLLAAFLAPLQLVSQPYGRGARVAVRVLGVRQLAQALVTVGAPNTVVLSLGVGADAAHGTSMSALALFSRRWRRAALVEALIATAFASVGAGVVVRMAAPARVSVLASHSLSPGERPHELGGLPLA
ncbi:MAG: hypothetical protein WCB86_06435 [Candidatus Dormiibacterota bacterium]